MRFNKDIINKLNQYFIQRMGMYPYTRGWIKGTCPICGKDKYGIHLGQDRSNCFYCAYHERPIHVLIHTEGLSTFQEAYKFLDAFSGLEYIEPVMVSKLKELGIELPEGYHLLNMGDSQWGKSARNYMKKRGFDINTLSMKGFGYCISGKYQGYIIMPFYYAGNLVYFNARRYLANGPKFNNPEIEEVGIGKAQLIYNIDALGLYNEVRVVESVLNAETLGNNVIATGGKIISNYQTANIIKSPVQKVTMILDPDAIKESIKEALKLSDYKMVRIVELPEGEDVNTYGKLNTKIKVWKSRYLTYNQILQMKHQYE